MLHLLWGNQVPEEPIADSKTFDARREEEAGWQLRSADLQEKQIHVDHRVAEVSLNVCHRLTFDLQAVSDPNAG